MFSAYNIYCYFSIMFFVISCFIPSLKVVFIQAKRHTLRQNIWAIAPILLEKLNMHAQFTLQDCARLPCKIARQLLCNTATCRIPCKVLHAICGNILRAILHRVGRPLVYLRGLSDQLNLSLVPPHMM